MRTIFIIITIVVVAIIIKTGWRPSRPSNIRWSWIAVALLVIAIGFGITSCNGRKAKAKTVTQTNLKSATNAPPTTTKIVKVGKLQKLHKFSDYADGCVTLDIKVFDFNWYPKGGRVTVFPPKGDPFVDTPGIDIKTDHLPGTWRWCPKDPSAIGVEVWQ